MGFSRLVPYKWEMIFLLWVAFFLNQADRTVYNVVLPLIKSDLGLRDDQLGLVVLAFTWTYGVLVPVAGYAGDVLRRKWIVCASLLFWSTTTVFTGVSTSLAQLIVFRGVTTGGGEAFYYPAANSLIAQLHHKTRALAMAIHQTGSYTGIVASGLIAGYLGEHFGWRVAFYAFGGLGVVWAMLLVLRLKHTPPPAPDDPDGGDAERIELPGAHPIAEEGGRVPLSVAAREIFRKPTIGALCLAFGGYQFAGIAYLTWMPTFLYEKFGLSLAEAGFTSMFFNQVGAVVGALVGGRLSDYWAARRPTARMETETLGLLLCAPFVLLMGLADNLGLCYLGLAGFGLFRGVYDSNLFAAPFDVVPPRLRSSAVGIMLAFGFMVGAVGPWLLGWVKQTRGLTFGIASMSFIYVAAALIALLASIMFFRRDLITPASETPAGGA